MRYSRFQFLDHDQIENHVHEWLPEKAGSAKAAILVVHGMGEHAYRYEHLAKTLTEHGYIVFATDQRGHGLTGQGTNSPGYLGRDGFNALVGNTYYLFNQLKNRYPSTPAFLFAHSMGSFVAQRFMEQYGSEIAGVILTGSSGKLGIIIYLGIFVAQQIAKKHGEDYASSLLRQMSFGSYNKRFQPNRTEFDWLSRDPAEVDKYLQDPFCGTSLTAGSFRDFLAGLRQIHKPSELRKIPKLLPVLILSGTHDPVGKFGKGVLDLVHTYRRHAVQRVDYKLYKDARHEILNETNREEVIGDILAWLDKTVA